jgi:hypothetical protein
MKGFGQSFNFFNLTKAKKDVFPANFAAEKTPYYIIRARLCVRARSGGSAF